MATIDVEWSDSNMEEFIPEDIIALVEEVLVPVTSFVSDAAEASAVLAEAAKLLSSAIPPTPDPLLLGIQALVNQLDDLLNDLVNTGGSLLLVPPFTAGLKRFSNFIRRELVNTRNAEVPNFSKSAYIGAWGVMAHAPDVVGIQAIYNDLVLGVSVDETISRKLNIPSLISTANFAAHDLKFKLARTAAPQEDTPWVTMQASQFIPKSGEIVRSISQYLVGINSQIARNPLDEFIDLSNQVAATAQAFSDDLQRTADFIDAVFPDIPIKLFKASPTIGGTEALTLSLLDWFDADQHTELSDVSDNAYTAGYIIVYGAPSLAQAQAIEAGWDALFLP